MRMLITPPATARDITVNVSDGTDAIKGATVAIGEDYTDTTDDDGQVHFEDVPISETSITVSKTGYATYTGTISSGNINITLTPVRNISFTIDDGADPVEGASVVIGETSKTTGSAGGCSFSDMPDGSHTVTVSKTGYQSVTQSITSDSTHTSFTISLTAVYDVTVTVKDNSTSDAIEGATVVMGEYNGTTDDSGEVTFEDVPTSEYSMAVNAEGYTEDTSTVTVDSTHTSFTVSLELQ